MIDFDLEKLIKEKNKELNEKYKYDKETWISISKIKDSIKKEFDTDGVAERTTQKYFNDKSSIYYHKSKDEIVKMWSDKSQTSRKNGCNVDGYIQLRYLNESDEKCRIYRENCINESKSMERKLIGVDACLKDFASLGYKFECRELKLMFPYKYKKKTYVINGRLDALFSSGDGRLLLIDWKNNEDIKTENRFQKLFGPCDKLDDCDMNLFTIQLHFYLYMLKKVYGIQIPIYSCIVQFPGSKDYFYKVYKPSFEYDEKMIEKIIKYVIETKIEKTKEK